MLFDIGWPELLLIGIVALVVIGPKDLPRAMRVAGFWVRKARSLSREFQSSIDQMIREAELEEVRQDLKAATEFNIEHEIRQTVDPDGSLVESVQPPTLPDFFTEAEGPPALAISEPTHAPPVLNGAVIATEIPLAADTPEPKFVGFELEASELAHQAPAQS